MAGLNTPQPRRAVPARPTTPKTLFSDEQEAFLAASHPRLLLSALAGCGKTTVLFEYARRRPHQRWKLLVLNRSLAALLAERSPDNVEVSTLHKMAYAAQGYLLSHKLVPGAIPLSALSRLSARQPEGFASALRTGLEQFCLSADPAPSDVHAPLSWRLSEQWDPHAWTVALCELWSACLDPASDMPVTHSVYLKRFCQQEHPWMGTHWMLDEAQDWPTAVLEAFARCARVSIRAGDPCQRLYAFRGASLGQWHDPQREQEFRLSRSWRSSHALAPWINACLARLPGSWQWSGHPELPCAIESRPTSATIEQLRRFSPSAILADRWETLDSLVCELAGSSAIKWPASSNRHPLPGPQPAILCSTIHGAKGLEFERLWLPDQVVRPGLTPAQSARLWYVALSRAQKAVSFPGSSLPQSTDAVDDMRLFEDDPGMDWIS